LIFPENAMADNLKPPAKISANKRPHQFGSAKGKKGGADIEVGVEWLIDTGADISTIRKSTADAFDLTTTAGSASGTTGGGGMLIKSGLTMKFTILDQNDKDKDVECSLDVAVKHNNAGSDILGMDQIAEVEAEIQWDPTGKVGRLRER
jgi:hypothetical protein